MKKKRPQVRVRKPIKYFNRHVRGCSIPTFTRAKIQADEILNWLKNLAFLSLTVSKPYF